MERPWLYISIIAALIVLTAWGSMRYDRPQSPLQELQEATATLDATCNDVCAGDTQTVDISLPSSTRMYATSEAICLQRNTSMFCVRCGCELQPTQIYNGTQPANLTCTISTANISCAT